MSYQELKNEAFQKYQQDLKSGYKLDVYCVNNPEDNNAKIGFQFLSNNPDDYIYHRFKSGKLETKLMFINGKPNGFQVWLSESSQVMVIRHWLNGKLHGIEVQYNPDGSVNTKRVYQDGEMVLDLCNDEIDKDWDNFFVRDMFIRL